MLDVISRLSREELRAIVVEHRHAPIATRTAAITKGSLRLGQIPNGSDYALTIENAIGRAAFNAGIAEPLELVTLRSSALCLAKAIFAADVLSEAEFHVLTYPMRTASAVDETLRRKPDEIAEEIRNQFWAAKPIVRDQAERQRIHAQATGATPSATPSLPATSGAILAQGDARGVILSNATVPATAPKPSGRRSTRKRGSNAATTAVAAPDAPQSLTPEEKEQLLAAIDSEGSEAEAPTEDVFKEMWG